MNSFGSLVVVMISLAGSTFGADVAFDMATARLVFEGTGQRVGLTWSGAQPAAPTSIGPSLHTKDGIFPSRAVTFADGRMTVSFDGGNSATFAVKPQRGFVLFELQELTCPQDTETFNLLRLNVAGSGPIAHTLNAAHTGSNVVCLMGAQPNVHAFPNTRGPSRSDHKGCTHELLRNRQDAREGEWGARFSAESRRKDNTGWSFHGKVFEEPLNLSGLRAIRVRVKGDSKGELLKIQLNDGSNGYRDDYITIDFSDNRCLDLTTPALNTLRTHHVASLGFYYNGLPGEQKVACAIDQVEAIVSRDGRDQVIVLEDFESPSSGLWLDQGISLQVETLRRYGLRPASFGVIACPANELAETIHLFEEAAHLPSPHPGGVWSKTSPWVRRSYFFLTSFHESQFDRALAIARRGGFHMILIGQESWCKATGHYEVNRRGFPDGLEGLKRTVRRFKDAGFRVGFHFLGASIDPPDPYLTPTPDPRLVKGEHTTLAADVDATSGVLPTSAAPERFPNEDGGYMGQGTVLQIGDELIVYRQRSLTPPFSFQGCVRGHLGTKAVPHKKGDRISHLVRAYGYHMYDMDTTLLDEVASHCTAVANACDADMLYFDGSEQLQGDHWYYNARLHKAFYDRLTNKNMLLQASSHSHYSWHIMSRSASADGHGDLKGYLDARSGAFDDLALNHMPLDVGWYYGYDPTSTPDMFEYVLGATIGYNSSMSFQVSVETAEHHPFGNEILDLIARYEKLRLSERIAPAVRGHLRIDPALTHVLDPGEGPSLLARRREYRLLNAADQPVFQRVVYEPWHQMSALDERQNTWRIRIDQAPAKLGLCVRVTGGPWLIAGPAYGDPNAKVLESFDDLRPYAGDAKGTAPVSSLESPHAGSTLQGVTQRLESTTTDVRQGARCGVYTATSARKEADGWSVIGKVYNPPLDLSWHKGVGLWMRGDGRGGAFKLQIRDTGPGVIDYYITNDFTGWRYQQLARPAKDPLDYAKVGQLLLYYNGLPGVTTVSCGLDDIKALPSLDTRLLKNPYVEIAGGRLGFTGTLAEGQIATLWPEQPGTVNGPDGAAAPMLPNPTPSILLPAGEHSVRFGCDGPLLTGCGVRLSLQPPERIPVSP